ncbi:MAG: DUF87 domain-containing protein [Candidatus Spechtbacteria bacterium]|nr:DUF87 domain-containing protein [Candidatus Spechtbacteria bacterium]
MAKKKNGKNNDKDFKRLRDGEKEKKPLFDLDPDVLKGVWGIFFIASSIFLSMSFFGMGGIAGSMLVEFSDWLLGIGRYILPLVLVAMAVIFFTSWRRTVYGATFLGVVLFLSSILGALSLTTDDGARGGMWGFIIDWPLARLFSVWGAALILVTAFISSILISFNVPVGKWFKRKKEELLGEDGEVVKKEESVEVKTFGEQSKIEQLNPALAKATLASVEKLKEEKKTEKKQKDDFELIPPKALASDFRLPPPELLEVDTGKPHSGDIVSSANIIKRTLQNFGIDVEMGEVNIGPTVTQFTLKPAEGIKLARITALHNDLSLALAAHPLRIEAPIPGRALIGIEVPNKGITTVRLRNIVEQEDFRNHIGHLTLALGRDVTGAPVYANLAKMPHLLIAGSTGSGKTIALNTLIVSLLYQNPPELLRLILIDPKRVEFPVYSDIPHLLAPVVVDNQKAVNAMRWAVGEMEHRFEVLSKAHARDIQSYNSNKKVVEENGPLPYIVLVIDELADIMTSRGKEAEALIVRLAQMSRAVGIHLVLATQRPSVEVITGLIKANITARMAFQVASQIDSRTVLDMAGAEKLLGAGDMLYLAPENSKPRRVQGAFVSDKEVKRVADFLREESLRLGQDVAQESIDDIVDSHKKEVNFDAVDEMGEDGDDPMYEEARRVVIEAQRASASLLQRRLRVGYARAARLIDMMEDRGVVGPGEGAKPREVFQSFQSYDPSE